MKKYTRTCSYCNRKITIDSIVDMPINEEKFRVCKECFDHIHEVTSKYKDLLKANNENYKLSNMVSNMDNIRPHVIKEYLDQYIVNQDKAKKTLAVAVYNHCKRIQHALLNPEAEPLEKSNVIMLGPSGCGKTALVSRMAKMLNIPFAVTDASSLTEAGFVGADVEIAVRNLYYAADKDITKTQHGIIYLDEFDKIARKSGENNSITTDPGHEGVQQGILKMLEGNVVEFAEQGQRRHPEANTIKVDTTNILFIVGGAFVGIDKIIAKRVNTKTKTIGFGAEITDNKTATYNELIHQVKPEDLMKFGILPEVIGRVPIICTLEELDKEALKNIMTSTKNSPIEQYKTLLLMDNAEIEFTDDALNAIAQKAIDCKTGARSLKGIIEDIMLDVMFDIPKSNEHRKILITKDCITSESVPEIISLNKVA